MLGVDCFEEYHHRSSDRMPAMGVALDCCLVSGGPTNALILLHALHVIYDFQVTAPTAQELNRARLMFRVTAQTIWPCTPSPGPF